MARVEAQIKRLGPDGLAKARAVLEQAKAENDAPIPEELLTGFPVPDVSSISWIPVQSAQEGNKVMQHPGQTENSRLVEHLNSDGDKLPFFVQFDHVQVGNEDCSFCHCVDDSIFSQTSLKSTL